MSKTQQALDWLLANPESTPHAAALIHGITPGCVYAAIKRLNARQVCKCCGQTLKGTKP